MERLYQTAELKAINDLRKLVYFLAENIDINSLWSIRAKARIEHLEVRGISNKQMIINLLIDCQKHSTLKDFLEGLFEKGFIGAGFIDIKSFSVINFELPDIENVSFEVPRDSCCYINNIKDGSIYHTPSVVIKPHKKYKCHYNKYCDICGEKIESIISHEWNDWQYVKATSCHQKRECSICKEAETRIHHDWTKWRSNKNGSRFRVCNHCHQEEFDIDGTWQGFVYWKNGSKDYWEVSIKTSGLLWNTTKAEIKVYVNVMENDQCEYIVLQKASVDMENKKIIIKGKKITCSTTVKRKYIPDSFIGEISHNCQFIEGTVSDGSSNTGILKLCF